MVGRERTAEGGGAIASKFVDPSLVTATSPQGESRSFQSRPVARKLDLSTKHKKQDRWATIIHDLLSITSHCRFEPLLALAQEKKQMISLKSH